jgi:hypothetical protein
MWDGTPLPSSEADLPPLDLEGAPEDKEGEVFVHEMPKKRYRVRKAKYITQANSSYRFRPLMPSFRIVTHSWMPCLSTIA